MSVTLDDLAGHNLTASVLHTNLVLTQCACYEHQGLKNGAEPHPQPNRAVGADGGVCFKCGGMTVRTGTCTTCTSCGESGGCG